MGNRVLFIVCLLLALACEPDQNITPDPVLTSPAYVETPSNLAEAVNSVCFIDEMTGFAAGDGVIFKTMDRGLTWKANQIAGLPLRSIYFVNRDVGFAVGGRSSCEGTNCAVPGSIAYKTTDAGLSWNELTIPYQRSELNSVFFIDQNVGFAVGSGLHIKTTDGGQSWQQFEFNQKGAMARIRFVDNQVGIAGGLFGDIFITKDQGQNWTKSVNESDGHIYDLCFVGKDIGFAGGQKEVIKTLDGGKTWQILQGSPSEVYFMHFADEKTGIAIGKGHYVGGDFGSWTTALYRTADGGLSWVKEDDVELSSRASFYDPKNGYAVAMNRTFSIKYE